MQNRAFNILGRGVGLLGLLAAAAAALFTWQVLRLPRATAVAAVVEPEPAWPEMSAPPAAYWDVVKRAAAMAKTVPSGPLSKRYRLAGTFFAFGGIPGTSENMSRRAVIDDLQTGQQHLVAENGTVNDAQVVSIFQDRIILRTATTQEELWLSFAGAPPARPAAQTEKLQPIGEQEPLEVTRFGKRVGERRWVFDREALMQYYGEVMDDPERLASIYLSLKADRDKEGKIAGYYLDTEGEQEFFKSVGLEEGDVIRYVNSMRMTSQSRAEYFLREFIKKRVSAIVLDVERQGKEEKLIYLIR